MTKYKCTKPDCKYESDKQGECCSQPLEEVSGKGSESHGKNSCDCC